MKQTTDKQDIYVKRFSLLLKNGLEKELSTKERELMEDELMISDKFIVK